ncbi:hypothetical protein [Streptomyces huiliensis]|uniref:hypothetical protein n=1 Tax=Streptomyces huiliensis TaxID=2876027 RepID=UPI001CBCC958|nr:hypothetical protein [Streptomyces huiliensis]MBZ4320845.1 hypothetical protein [Streptomyces huiliensis]
MTPSASPAAPSVSPAAPSAPHAAPFAGPRPALVAAREQRSPEQQGWGGRGEGEPTGRDQGAWGDPDPGPSDQERRGREEQRPGTPEEPDNPFAAPPADRPDRPWRPREPQGGGGADGSGGRDGSGQPPAWGSQWSSRQPGRHDGGFGGPQGGGQDPANGGSGGGPRWDPTDPAQRRARYALLAGLWGFFFALFSLPEVALLLGALSVYWAVSSLRAKAGRRTGDGPAPTPAPQPGGFRPQTTAAVSGLVMGGLALVIAVSTFSFQLIYRDYYTCVDDALTQTSRQSCENHLPKPLRPLLSVED